MEQARDGLHTFRRATEFLMHGPFPIEELGIDREALMSLRRLGDIIPDGIPGEAHPKTKAKRRKKTPST